MDQGSRPTPPGHVAAPVSAPAGDHGQIRIISVVLALVAGLIVTVAPVAAQQEPGATQVAGLEAVQRHGFATLRWDPVAGFERYDIYRTEVDANNQPTGSETQVGVWRPPRQVPGLRPTFAESGFVPGERYAWRVRAHDDRPFPTTVVVHEPSAAAGTYAATQAAFGSPFPEDGFTGDIVLVNAAGTTNPTQACGPLVDFPVGAIALVDRGCTFTTAATNVQNAGASAMLIVNSAASAPVSPTGTAPNVTIPVGMLWRDDGEAIKAALPASATVSGYTGEPASAPVFDTTLPQWGDPGTAGQNLRTQWETALGAQFTSDVNEYAYTAAVDEGSDRVRVVELGRTLEGRPINMFIIGYPRPPDTAEEIVEQGSAMVNCNVHGNEPSSREACLIMARELAFSDDPRIIDILSKTTVLIVPTINGDGRARNTRGNAHGNQDLNRDHSMLREPETFAFATALRDYQSRAAFDGHEFGNNSAGDLPVLMPRHLNVAQIVFDQSKHLIEEHLYTQGSEDGWWYCPYGCQGGGNVGLSQETILRNTLGLKSVAGILLEARSGAGPTRPNATTAANNRRKGYSALYTYHEFLDYYIANQEELERMREESIAFQISNTGRIVFRGSRPLPAFPAPHPGQAPPPNENPSPAQILEEPPCGYRLTDEQVNGARNDHDDRFPTTVGERMAAHGWTVEQQGDTYLVRMNQPQRGLIPLLLDGQAAEPWLSGERLFDPLDCVTFLSVLEELERLVAAGGINPGIANTVRQTLDHAERWMANPSQAAQALRRLDNEARLLDQQAAVITRTSNGQGDPAGLRALASTLRTLSASLSR